MRDSIKNKPWFLLLMPVFLFLHIEKEYFRLIDYTNVAAEVAWLLTSTAVIVVLPLLLFGYNQRSWLIAFFSLLFLYFLGPLKDWLQNSYRHLFIAKYTYFLPIAICLYILIVVVLFRTKSNLTRLIQFLNFLLLTFIFADLASVFYKMATRKDNQTAWEQSFSEVRLTEEQKPDVYYIIFDMYTSSSVLKDEFGFDNYAIEEYLGSKNFRILKNAESNYNLTPFSVGSTLNMEYADQIDTTQVITQEKYFPGFNLVAENRVFKFFENQGYTTSNFSSFNISENPRMKESYDIWQTGSIIYKHHFFHKVYKDIGWRFIRQRKDEMPAYMTAAILHDQQVSKNLLMPRKAGSPTFVYAHFFKPHDPYTHDSSGVRPYPVTTFSEEEEKKLYIDQVKYVNEMMKKITTSLLTRARRPLVIIFQGDHGFRFSMDPEKRSLEFKNFTAIYCSDKNYDLFSDMFSNVNTFRIILNKYFGQQLTLLPHNTYYLKYKTQTGEQD